MPQERARKAVFYAVLLGVVVATVELSGRLAYTAVFGRSYSAAGLSELAAATRWAAVRDAAAEVDAPSHLVGQVLHPYLGFVLDARQRRTHGFPDDQAVVRRRNPDDLVIAIVGGSVAQQMTPRLREVFTRHVARKSPGTTAVVLGLNLQGYKQPQQALAVAYVLSLGGHFDLVINVDGYNEVVLPVKDNYIHGTYPFFPRLWKTRLLAREDAGNFAMVGKLEYLRELQGELIEAARTSPLRHSALYGLYAGLRLSRLEKLRVATETALVEGTSDSHSFETDGPFRPFKSVERLLERSALVWYRGSLLIDHAARGFGFEYFHFLQPNQYVPGSKPLSETETKVAYDPTHPRARYASAGYAELRELGRRLTERGVGFFDSTMIFSDRTETLYDDVCCHYNSEGIAIFADEILARVVENTGIETLRAAPDHRAAAP